MESQGPDGKPGYDHVVRLANSLVDLRNDGFITQQKADKIVTLWDKLSEDDKGALVYPAHHRERLVKGRFKVSHFKTNVTPGADSLKRCFLGEGSGPAQWPNASRLVEAVCLALCRIYPAGQTVAGVRVNRWAAILRDYRIIRDVVLDSPRLMAETRLQLFELNQQTLSQWHNARKKSRRGRSCSRAFRPLPVPWWPLNLSHLCCLSIWDRSGMGTRPMSSTFLRMHRDRQCSVFEANPLQWAQRRRLLPCLLQHNRSKASLLQSRWASQSLTQPTCFKLQTLQLFLYLLLHLLIQRCQEPQLGGGGRRQRQLQHKVQRRKRDNRQNNMFVKSVANQKQKSLATVSFEGFTFVQKPLENLLSSGWRR